MSEIVLLEYKFSEGCNPLRKELFYIFKYIYSGIRDKDTLVEL